MSRTGAHAFLYQQCRDLHDRLDSHPLLHKLGSPALESGEYAEALQALQHCLEPAEAALLAYEPELEAALPAPYIPRCPWLCRDLQAIGRASWPAPPCVPQRLSSFAAYLGYRYVLEGAALGSARVLQMIRKHGHIDDSALHYLRRQESQARGWAAFVSCLNETLVVPEDLEQAKNAARNLFSYLCSTLDTQDKAS